MNIIIEKRKRKDKKDESLMGVENLLINKLFKKIWGVG
jgi:hypothetical protein